MNIYKHLRENDDNKNIFCEELLKNVPELLVHCSNGEDDCKIFGYYVGTDNIERLFVGLYKKSRQGAYYNIFDILNKPIDTWECFYSKHSVLYDMAFRTPGILQKLVFNFVSNYEKNILRKEKFKILLDD